MFSKLIRLTVGVAAVGYCTSLLAVEHTKDSLKSVWTNIQMKKAVLIDVREKDEWKDGHLQNAVLLPLSEIEKGITQERLEKIAPKGTIIYLHCAFGSRSLQAAESLSRSGRDLRALQSGYDDLVAAGFPKDK